MKNLNVLSNNKLFLAAKNNKNKKKTERKITVKNWARREDCQERVQDEVAHTLFPR